MTGGGRNAHGSMYSNMEMGFAPPPLPPPGDLPPGDGGTSVPHFLTFQALIQTAARTYRWTTDEALKDSWQNALAMRRDVVLWAALRSRQMPTAQLTFHIEPRDETDPAEIESAKLVTELLSAIPRFQLMKMQLLEAIWYGKYAVELAWEWKDWKGQQCLMVRDFLPINGDKLRFQFDGTPAVLVYAAYPGERQSTDWGLAHILTPDERQQYIIHKHEPDDADWTEPQMAGSIMGVGLRGRLYWFWWLKQQVFALLMNYLERFANGLTIFYYNAHDANAKAEAEAAARDQFSSTALLYPRWNSENPDTNKVERLEVGTASPALLQGLVTEYFDNVMVKAILGQTLSSSAEATGMGSGVADLHGETLDEIIKYDAVNLGETLQTDLVDVLYRYNCPGVRPGKFSFEVDTPNADEVLQNATQLFGMGMTLDEDQLYEVSQLSKPKPGAGIVSQMGAISPAAVGGMPQGVPVAGQPGPATPSSQMAQGQSADPSQMAAMQQGMPQGGQPALAYRRQGLASSRVANGMPRRQPVPRPRLPRRVLVTG